MKGTRRFLQGIVGNGADSQAYIKGTGRYVADAAEGRSLNNLFTGKTLGDKGRKLAGGGIVGGLGVYSLMTNDKAVDREIQESVSNDDIQSLITSRADGAGYTAHPRFNMSDYAPSGDLVFALHNLRNGG